jgi:N-methylhydantoinase B
MTTPPYAETAEFDPVETEVFFNRLLSITDEVMTSLIRSSFSTNIKERKDASVALFDVQGRLVCQALYIPMLLSGVLGGVESLIKLVDLSTIEEGDAFICNDAYLAGGTHSSDISIITPVFHEGSLVFFVGNICHHADVGGIVPGSTDHTLPSIFAEGIRIPLIKIVRRHEIDNQLLHLIAVNTRDPEERVLDLKAQIAVNEKGVQSLNALLSNSGVARIRKAVHDLLSYTERRMRSRIQELPDGVFEAESWTDDEGVPGAQKCIKLAIHISGGQLRLDFTGTDTQAMGAINVPRYPLIAACFIGLNSIIDPEIPTNDGMFRAVTITAPEGTLLNPRFPAAIGNREFTAQRVVRAIFLAMSKAVPEQRALAASADINTGMAFYGLRNTGTPFVYVEAVAGGIGALFHKDGMHGAQGGITNSANTPTEPLEIEFPLLVREYGLEVDSVGAGRTQGGAGIIRDISALVDGVSVSTRADGKRTPAPGLFSGHDGAPSRLELHHADGSIREIEMYLVDHPLKSREAVRLITPGGAGFGSPKERGRLAVKADVHDGLITRKFARDHYDWSEG